MAQLLKPVTGLDTYATSPTAKSIVKFLWKGYVEALTTTMSVAYTKSSKVGYLNFAVIIHTCDGERELESFVAAVPELDALDRIKSGQLIKDFESIALELMYETAKKERIEAGGSEH